MISRWIEPKQWCQLTNRWTPTPCTVEWMIIRVWCINFQDYNHAQKVCSASKSQPQGNGFFILLYNKQHTQRHKFVLLFSFFYLYVVIAVNVGALALVDGAVDSCVTLEFRILFSKRVEKEKENKRKKIWELENNYVQMIRNWQWKRIEWRLKLNEILSRPLAFNVNLNTSLNESTQITCSHSVTSRATKRRQCATSNSHLPIMS